MNFGPLFFWSANPLKRLVGVGRIELPTPAMSRHVTGAQMAENGAIAWVFSAYLPRNGPEVTTRGSW